MENLIIIDEEAKELLDKARKITGTTDKSYSIQSFIYAIEDLLNEINDLNDKIQDMNEDMKYNYKHISKYEEIGYKEKDFL